ncbi:LacI family DNA-binding transcriptional regulator [Nonomuraea roseoviolacea]|uniref:DNA-binding LacI/PurR family transcriptional regulator n=1 Tax=Nonomuraea roseoviolacea subsp. carminata TaxID=160689 RepID=A0ABT1KAU2_9ACTN|nr:LacI family DNA-binding transcriptional regulator [Nonomuraea roseoviolacea]MCP2350074.1 DNA-binding LacI/PurR family transcriptional regulator [Nonomuraea roseoviolacea subsp. carminata]
MKIGIVEVAERAGVSEATVSRVINRRAGVSAKTRAAVESAMAELGYERSTRGQIVAVITPWLSNPFFAEVAELVEAALAPHGLKGVVCPALPGGIQEREFVTALAEHGVAGVVFLSASNTIEGADPETYDVLAARRIPFVGVNGGFEGHDAPVLSTDDHMSAELAVDHLWSLGHRRIGLASGPSGNRPADRRAEGFRTAMTRRGAAESDAPVVRQHYTVEGGQSAASELLRRGVTAVVAASDFMALGVYRAVLREGLSVPGEVSVVGHDGSMIMEFVDPPLTTVRQPIDRLAKEVARSIVALVSNRDVPQGELLFSPELVVRGSTAPPRGA